MIRFFIMNNKNTSLRVGLLLVVFLPVVAGAFMFSLQGRWALFPSDSLLRGFRVSPVQIALQIPLSGFNHLTAISPECSEPFWDVAMWNCGQSLSESNRYSGTVWSNEYTMIRLAESDPEQIQLTLDSLAVYSQSQFSYTQMQQTRPHFLLSRNFYPDEQDGMKLYGTAAAPFMDGSSIPNLNTLQSLELTLEATLVDVEQLQSVYPYDDVANWDQLYNRNSFSAHFIVYCRDPALASYGKWFWLGFMIYDSNLPYSAAIHYETDQLGSDGNGNYSYLLRWLSLYGDDYQETLDAFHAGQETPIALDVLSAVRKALSALQNDGAFIDVPADLSGLTLSHFNIGWEVKAPMRGTIKLNNMCLNMMSE
jgi:hypothetical protein